MAAAPPSYAEQTYQTGMPPYENRGPYEMPPNAQPQYQPQPAVITHTTVTKNSTSGMRNAIPELPMALAIVCCVINFLLPGIGTIIAGFSVLCCGNVGQSGGGRFGTFCVNFWVGILQLATCVFFFLGWVWSIVWGLAFIPLAAEANKQKTTTTTTVINQPMPMATAATVTTTGYVTNTSPV